MVPESRGEHPEQGEGQLGAARAQQARDAQDFAGAHAQGRVGEGTTHRRPLHLEDRGLVNGARLVALLREVAPRHVAGETRAVELLLRAGDDLVAGAQDREALRDLEDLLELVGHEEDRDTARLQVADDVEEGRSLPSW